MSDIDVAPDIHSSTEEYASRFSGPAGQWLLEVQASAIKKVLLGKKSSQALDIGGGHAQMLEVLLELGYKTIVQGSDPSCGIRILSKLQQGDFIVSPLKQVPVPSMSFPLVTCLRQLSHIDDWQALIAELCRISKELVIIDYPVICSFNIFYSCLFKIKKLFEGNTRQFLIFKNSEVLAEFAKHGFYPSLEVKQFFLPMVIHRQLNNKKISNCLENFFNLLGLTKFFGSPVIAGFVRK